MPFFARIWCPDCRDTQDSEGCFGGGEERLGPFESKGEAIDAAEEVLALEGDAIWACWVERK